MARHRSRIFRELPSVCVGNAEFSIHSRPRTSTRWSHPHLGTSLSLAPSDQIRTETTSLLICDGDSVGQTRSSIFQTLSPQLALTSQLRPGFVSEALFSSVSQPFHQSRSLTSRSRTPPTLQCSLPAIRSRSCFTYLANFLHIQRLVSSALRSSSTQRRLPINYSSSPIGFNSRIVDGILVALTSFFSVVQSAAFSFSGLALCLLHSEARPVRTPHVLLPLTRGLVPTSRIESHCFTRPRFQLDCRRVLDRTPPNELDRHGPPGQGLNPSRYFQLRKCFNGAISHAVHVFLRTVLLPSTRPST